MGLCVALKSASGEQMNFIADEHNLLDTLLGYPDWKAFPMLASIDRYGDTTFNRMQIKHFLDEWSSLFARAKNEEERELLEAVRSLGEQQGDLQYLTFIGD